ncbi:MAG: NADP-dependent malic enzyme [Clostridiales Family XIII bacterium]|jgi:malate dehydrogenase (oxaloacetate-decarboxylating)|nr:NADP-dependent malic enzyme [Clostridiales Family XIII bacterium]
MNYYAESLKGLAEKKGRLDIFSNEEIVNKNDLSITYTPGVSEPCRKIFENQNEAYKYTIKGRTVAVVTDGSAVLGLGDIGAKAAIPVMEGKCALFNRFAGLNAFPICLETNNIDEIVDTVIKIAPIFGGINLEDISAPRCFEIEKRLIEKLDIPVFHDDQHGTAIVVTAALINASRLSIKNISELQIVIAGAGAAGTAIAKMLLNFGVKDIILTNSKGIISKKNFREENETWNELLKITNKKNRQGKLEDALIGADIFIGVSAPDIITKEMILSMNENPFIFAMSNPVPEIMPDIARDAGAAVIATGRSDFPNQINNVLAFPGVFKGALEGKKKKITEEMKKSAAKALAYYIKDDDLSEDYIIPSPFDDGVADTIAKSIKNLSNYD